METRILSTDIWRDHEFRKLDDKDARILLFILTNDQVTVLPAYKIGFDEIAFYTGTTVQKVENLIPRLKYFGVFFIENFFLLTNKFTRAKYSGGKTTEKRLRVWSEYPTRLQEIIDIEGSIGQSFLNDSSIIGDINHKPITNNHKTETIKQKPEIKNPKEEDELDEILDLYNSLLNTSYKSKVFAKNFEYWRETYSLEDIKRAIGNLASGKWWAKDPSPQMIFRTKSPKGENVDYIGELLNLKVERLTEAQRLYREQGGES